jgi:enoyl-[acyl-carrier protein] reductase II
MGGAMTWVSGANLVAAISNAGGFGVIASGSMSPDLLSREIAATAALTKCPFGVNLITMHPQLLELIDVCIQHRVSCRAGRRHTDDRGVQRIRAGGRECCASRRL